MLLQYYTGFDPRKPDFLITSNNQLSNNHYRTFGFYGHPLTIASVGLAYFSFFWTLFWQWVVLKKEQKIKYIPFQNNQILQALCLLSISLFNLGAVFTSVGRTATVIGMLFLILIPLFFIKKKKVFFLISFLFLCSALSLFAFKKVGFEERLNNSVNVEQVKNHPIDGDYRLVFWKTYVEMIKEKPLLGFGSYWIDHGIRDYFYDNLGYEKIPQKYNAHNNYLEILACVGFFGAFAILFCLYQILKIFRFSFRKKNNNNLLSIAFSVSLLANLFHSFTQNVFFDSSVTYIYLSLLLILTWQNFVYQSHLQKSV
ncbi:MAG: O-antigen ligase family protein [Silvanigrellaceae bacterium]|nr:O-antigen ligase family protein [Silvanigrellaceae bacterium]